MAPRYCANNSESVSLLSDNDLPFLASEANVAEMADAVILAVKISLSML